MPRPIFTTLCALSLLLARIAPAADTFENQHYDGQQPVPDLPFQSDAEMALSPFTGTAVADGPQLEDPFPTYRNCLIEGVRGVGIAPKQGNGRAIDCVVRRVHTGIKMTPSDMEVRGCRVHWCRDCCLWLPKDSGNCQSSNNHFHAARIAAYNEGAFPYRSSMDTFADSWIGYLGIGASDKSVFTNGFWQHNTVRDAAFSAGGCVLNSCIVDVMRDVKTYNCCNWLGVPEFKPGKAGIEMGGDRNGIHGCIIELMPYKHPLHEYTGLPATAVIVSGNEFDMSDTKLSDFDGIDGSIGIRVKNKVDANGRAQVLRGIKIDCQVTNFDQAKERVITFDHGDKCTGLDITLRLTDYRKPIDNYVDIGAGWTGTFRVINTTTGVTTTFAKGSAH